MCRLAFFRLFDDYRIYVVHWISYAVNSHLSDGEQNDCAISLRNGAGTTANVVGLGVRSTYATFGEGRLNGPFPQYPVSPKAGSTMYH